MKKRREKCPHCGQLMPVMYCHALNSHLVHAANLLMRAGQANPRLMFKDNYTIIANFQKLGYFGIVEQVPGKSGFWRITPEGREFLEGHAGIYSHVWTLKGKKVRDDGDIVTVRTYLGAGFEGRADYAREREEITPPPQFQNGRLF